MKIVFVVFSSLSIRSSDLSPWPRGAVGSASNSRARGPGKETPSGHILSFLLPLIQEGQLSITCESTLKRNRNAPHGKYMGYCSKY